MIPTYQSVLYATNLETYSRKVFRHALGVAQRYDAKVHVVHVIPEIEISHQQYVAAMLGDEQFKELGENFNRELIGKLQGDLRGFAADELQDHPEYLKAVASIEVLRGHPAERILQRADELDADLLVFGTHAQKEGGFDFLGSVVKRVLRRTRRPVLVVPVRDEP